MFAKLYFRLPVVAVTAVLKLVFVFAVPGTDLLATSIEIRKKIDNYPYSCKLSHLTPWMSNKLDLLMN